jgi:hypothetical protein
MGIRFLETEAVRAAVQRSLSGEPMAGRDIRTLIAAVAGSDRGA